MKTKIFSVIISVIIVSLFFFFAISCDEESSAPDCEENNYGTVIVKNRSGNSLWVDVTWGSSDINDERKISNGSQTTYNRVSAGSIKIWGSRTGYDGWQYSSEYVGSCQELTFTWYSKKSTSIDNLWLEISDGEDVIKTTYDLEFDEKQ